jgi:CO/xanthine dehydrogenase FAD-binding subunit
MKPPPFEYFEPTDLEEALQLLREYGDDGVILAGGQSLLPVLNFRLTQPEILIDINRLESNSDLEVSHIQSTQSELRFGPLTRQRELELSSLVLKSCPLLSGAARYVGNPTIRNRGTFAGSLAHGDPAGEFPLVATILGAEMLLLSENGSRRLTSEEFFLGHLSTALDGSELLAQIHIPCSEALTGWGFHELDVTPRALIAAAALVTLDQDGKCSEARLGFAGMGPVPMRARKAETLLEGQKINRAIILEAAHVAATQEVDPVSDEVASASYRTALAETFLARAIIDAMARLEERH